jgi:DNA polymerase-3 subunit alpha
LRLLDCTNSVEELIQTAANLGYCGLAISDHESVSAHVQAIKKTRELKKKGKIPEDFKLILGNELYLVDDVEETKNSYKSGVTKFPHFILLSRNSKGHEQLRLLSSLAWSNSFYTGTMERVPTGKKDLERIVKENPNNLIASTACLGSEINIHLLAKRDAELNREIEKAKFHDEKVHAFIKW